MYLALCSSVSTAIQLSLTAASGHDRLGVLRERSQHKASKYRQQVEAAGARLEPLAIGAAGLAPHA